MKIGDRFKIRFGGGNTEMEFCWIPGGTFWMGSWEGYSTEQPLHRVSIHETTSGAGQSPGFWMGRFPVTQRQYAAFRPDHQSGFQAADGDVAAWLRPVEEVSWEDAMEFVSDLNELPEVELPGGFVLSLPTEAE
ncbi:MAG: SUMF1/EgtB/PvdO family nonheme iron enzyme, partial [Planctomycetota bacterium]